MSLNGSSIPPDIFFDTSVLVDFVLPDGDRGSRDLIMNEELQVIISSKVESEFNEVPERKAKLYADVVDYLISGGELEEFDEADLSSNDRGTFDDIQDAFEDVDRTTVLSRLRERQREISKRKEFIENRIDQITPRSNNLELLFSLSSAIGNEDDCQVVADASNWSENGGSGYLTTLDYNHLINYDDEINSAISEHQPGGELIIRPPSAE
ncbi:hypothetical protein ABNG02_15835 [Halorubrum ejinorense]|uniref:DUF4935 domain-containing protein n=1 Tax=Halorubrum ejinorense TaxID=425309 RepID=A0AAV3SRE3_9EURY